MTANHIIFFIISAVIILSSVMAVTSRSIYRAALCMLAVIAATSILFVMLKFILLAVIQLVIYAGGVAALLIHYRRRTGQTEQTAAKEGWIELIIAGAFSIGGTILTIITIINFRFAGSQKKPLKADLDNFGAELFSGGKDGNLLPLIMVMVLIVVTFIAVRVLERTEIQAKPGKCK